MKARFYRESDLALVVTQGEFQVDGSRSWIADYAENCSGGSSASAWQQADRGLNSKGRALAQMQTSYKVVA